MRNYTILHEIKEHAWQQSVLRFHDSVDYIIEVRESMEAVIRRLKVNHCVEDLIKKNGMPKEFVEHVK